MMQNRRSLETAGYKVSADKTVATLTEKPEVLLTPADNDTVPLEKAIPAQEETVKENPEQTDPPVTDAPPSDNDTQPTDNK